MLEQKYLTNTFRKDSNYFNPSKNNHLFLFLFATLTD